MIESVTRSLLADSVGVASPSQRSPAKEMNRPYLKHYTTLWPYNLPGRCGSLELPAVAAATVRVCAVALSATRTRGVFS